MKNNASLDKFCKIKAKKEEKHKKSATNGQKRLRATGIGGVEEEKHKMGDDNEGEKLQTSGAPNSTLSTIIACGNPAAILPFLEPLLNFSRGIRIIQIVSRISPVGRFVSLEPESAGWPG